MDFLMALTDKVLREAGLLDVYDSRAQAEQAEMLVRFMDRPALPAYAAETIRGNAANSNPGSVASPARRLRDARGAAANKTLLCIDRDASELRIRKRLLKKHGYRVMTATNGNDGLRMFTLVGVDAIVVGYYLGLMDGATVAAEIKQIKPHLPIVMLADSLELPDSAFHTVDAVVAKGDGPQFLLSTLKSVLGAGTMPLALDESGAPSRQSL